MKSILIEKPNQLSIIEREIPTPSAGEVRVKVKLAGICGSDSHIYRGHNPFAKYPRVIGHEFFGVIDAVGEGVESARVGERVAVDPVVSCGHCYPCSIGKPNVCTTLAVLGVHADGGFSEYAVVPAKNAWKIPEAVADQYAVMIEPFTIAANVTGHGQPTENDTVLVYGAAGCNVNNQTNSASEIPAGSNSQILAFRFNHSQGKKHPIISHSAVAKNSNVVLIIFVTY